MIWLLLAACTSHRDGPPNVVLVSIDTLRADRIDAIAGSGTLSPNIDRFSAESVTFTQAYSQATITGPSHLSLFSSRYPTEVVSLQGTDADRGVLSMTKVLSLYGYQTGARTAGGDLVPDSGPLAGFDSYEASINFGSLWHTVPMAMDWVDHTDPKRPFFLFVHGYDTHTTYLKPSPWGLLWRDAPGLTPEQIRVANATDRIVDGQLLHDLGPLDELNRAEVHPRSPEAKAHLAARLATLPHPPTPVTAADEAMVKELYAGAVTWADAQFGRLMAALEARGRLDDTIVILLGDHGEALGEDGIYHRCCSVADGLTHVPLIVRLPKGEGGGRKVEQVVRLIDVMPTVLELVGATVPAGVRGESLVPALHGQPIADRMAVSLAGFGWRVASIRGPKGRLTYSGVQVLLNLFPDVVQAASLPGPSFTTEGDPSAADQATYRDALVAWGRALDRPEKAETPERSPELVEEMKKHGYWDAR